MTPFEAMYGRKDSLYYHTPSMENISDTIDPISTIDSLTANTSEIIISYN